LEYHDGRPLGMLLGAILQETTREEQSTGQKASFSQPLVVGLGCEIKPAEAGTLYFRVNDSGGQLNDNRGSLMVTISEVSE
jgi:hypothetical protein